MVFQQRSPSPTKPMHKTLYHTNNQKFISPQQMANANRANDLTVNYGSPQKVYKNMYNNNRN